MALGTEALDGFLARKFNWVTTLGERLDPIADKIFFASVLITWKMTHMISWKFMFALSTREIGLLLVIGFLFLFRRNSRLAFVPSMFFGKITTALQYMNIIFALWKREFVQPLIVLTAAAGLFATLQYYAYLSNNQSSLNK